MKSIRFEDLHAFETALVWSNSEIGYIGRVRIGYFFFSVLAYNIEDLSFRFGISYGLNFPIGETNEMGSCIKRNLWSLSGV